MWALNLVSHIEREAWLRVFENRMLRKVSGPSMDPVTKSCNSWHNENFHDLYCSPDARGYFENIGV
jgi:hypothetical protein